MLHFCPRNHKICPNCPAFH